VNTSCGAFKESSSSLDSWKRIIAENVFECKKDL